VNVSRGKESPRGSRRGAIRLLAALCCAWCVGVATQAHAGVPVTLFESLAGNLDFTGTEATFRANTNPDSCSLNGTAATTLTGIRAGATVRRAYLYWAGSGSTVDTTVTFSTPGGTQVLTASRTFTETFVFNGTNYDFFSAFVDVTALVTAGGNGSYSMTGLSVNSGNPHCPVSAVMSGWSLIVVYEHPAEPLRVVNLYDGFRFFRGGQITISPSNFVVPTSPIDGRLAHVTWEGDAGNSSALGGFTENLRFEGVPLTDGLNPLNNQFNSQSNIIGDTNSHGVDFDAYDISALLSAGMTSATSVYSSGGDLVLLSAEVFSVTNTPVADLRMNKSHVGDFIAGANGTYTLSVTNLGPSDHTGTLSVVDTLPAGLTFSSATGSGWSCGAAGQTVTCTSTTALPAGGTSSDITLTVAVAAGAAATVTNAATVTGALFDNIAANNSASDPTTVRQPVDLIVVKSVTTLSDPFNGGANPKAVPGATIQYTILVSNQGAGTTDPGTLRIDDTLPAQLSLFVGNGTASPVTLVDGSPTSTLSLTWGGFADLGDDVDFDDGTGTFTYVPTAGTFDPLVRAIRIHPTGSMAGAGGGGNPSFELRFTALIQ